MVKRIFTGKQMSFSNYRKSAAMGKLMKNSKISGTLDSKREQKEFYSALSKYGSGGITKDEFRKTLGDLYENSRTISRKEVKEIGRAMKGELGKNRIEKSEEKIKEIIKNQPSEPSRRTKMAERMPPQPSNSFHAINLISAVPSQQKEGNNIISFSRFKKPSKKASDLLDNILNKKSA